MNKNDFLYAQAKAALSGEGSVGDANAHAGLFGVGVQVPEAGGMLQANNKGLRIHGAAKAISEKVDVGPVKHGAGVGLKGTLRAGYNGVGAIVPGVGGMVVANDGLDLSISVFNF